MNPDLAQALAVVAPFIVAALVKAKATNRARAAVAVLLTVAIVAATYLGDAHPEQFSALVAFVGQLFAITVASYKTVDGLLGGTFNERILPEVGLE